LSRPTVTRLDILEIVIKEIFDESHKTYGYRRIKAVLLKRGVTLGRALIRSLMKKRNLVSRAAKKRKTTTDSNHGLPVADNLLNRNFSVTAPNKIWVCDFTYIHTGEGWLYLAVVIDLYSRRVVGYNIHNRMTKELVIDAMNMAIRNRKPQPGLIVHSDRGSQYCSREYQKILKNNGLICSMSRKGDPWDNACAESFFNALKVELIYDSFYETHTNCSDEVTDYIEVFYNRRRLHSYLGYRTPCEFEAA
jgi:transposase InsO family protein